MLCEKYPPIIEENKDMLLNMMVNNKSIGYIEMTGNNNSFKEITKFSTSDERLSYDIVDMNKQVEKVNKLPFESFND